MSALILIATLLSITSMSHAGVEKIKISDLLTKYKLAMNMAGGTPLIFVFYNESKPNPVEKDIKNAAKQYPKLNFYEVPLHGTNVVPNDIQQKLDSAGIGGNVTFSRLFITSGNEAAMWWIHYTKEAPVQVGPGNDFKEKLEALMKKHDIPIEQTGNEAGEVVKEETADVQEIVNEVEHIKLLKLLSYYNLVMNTAGFTPAIFMFYAGPGKNPLEAEMKNAANKFKSINFYDVPMTNNLPEATQKRQEKAGIGSNVSIACLYLSTGSKGVMWWIGPPGYPDALIRLKSGAEFNKKLDERMKMCNLL